jgi:hypothetical protein
MLLKSTGKMKSIFSRRILERHSTQRWFQLFSYLILRKISSIKLFWAMKTSIHNILFLMKIQMVSSLIVLRCLSGSLDSIIVSIGQHL